jgi:ionotropic glutamate receptor
MGADRLLVLCLALAAAAVVAGQRRPSAVTVGALFTYESTIGRAARLAIELAVDDVNEDAIVLAGTKLNLITHDTNCSSFLGTIEGQLRSLHLLLQFCYTTLFFLQFISIPHVHVAST